MIGTVRLGYAAASILLGVATACSGPKSFYVRNAEVSVESGVRPIGPRSIAEPQFGSYYFFFRGANVIMVDHFFRSALNQPRQRLLYLETDQNGKLLRTVKDDELLQGTYGTIHATKTCFFEGTVGEFQSSVSISAGDSKLDQEVPSVLASVPPDAPQLTALTLIRIYREDSGYVVVSGNYEVNGRLGSLNVIRTKRGDRVSFGTARIAPELPNPQMITYGILPQIDPAQFARLNRLRLPNVEKPQVATLVYRQYGFGSIFEENLLKGDAVVSSRILQPVADQESTLRTLCNSRLLQQQSIGLSTVF